ncbi:MAG: hydantoinase/oxoprolinase family protein [Candidatus Rokuibacteriota bacterium]
MTTLSLQLAVDIGGTFTDVVLLDERGRAPFIEKVLTTHGDPAAGVMAGVQQALGRAGVTLAAVRFLIHGTTLVTNAIIERTGAPTGLITTGGHEDALELGREARYDSYDIFIERPQPLVPGRRRLGLSARMLSDGSELRPLDPAEVDAAVARLVADGVEAIAVSLLHSYRDPSHEERVAARIAAVAPSVRVSASSRVVREIREYERTSTTVANVYVLGVVDAYLRSLLDRLRAGGFSGELLLMLSSGGTCTVQTAREVPIRLIESGPAGGAAASAYYARTVMAPRVLSFDMGGTTAKVCFIDEGEPQITREMEVARVWRFKRGSGLPIIVPVLELIEIGAGGGSIATIDSMGLPKVGPESAGSEPGPACYGRGGTRPTVTDANLLLGYLDPGYFLGGAMALDREAAEAAVRRHVAEPLGVSVTEAAWAIYAIVTENMANAALIHGAERGKEISTYDLYAYGGAGPMHASALAEKLAIARVVIPPGAGARSCFGFLGSPLSFEVARSHAMPLADCDWAEVGGLLASLEGEAKMPLARAGVAEPDIAVRRWCEMRYVGQGHEVEVALPDGAPGAPWQEEIRTRFEAVYRSLYHHVPRGLVIESVTWRVRAQSPPPVLPDVAAARGVADAHKGDRQIYLPERGEFGKVPVYDRYALRRGTTMQGPAIVEEVESTTVVGSAFTFEVDAADNLVLAGKKADARAH